MFVTACEADARGRKGREHEPYPQAQLFLTAHAAARAVDTAAVAAEAAAAGISGEALGNRIRERRAAAIRDAIVPLQSKPKEA